jgi:iron-sulfur cluster assembly protein
MSHSPETHSSDTYSVVRLTDAALAKIQAMKIKEGKPDHFLRLAVVTGGCAGLSYDMRFQKQPYDNDLIFEQNELKILLNPDSVAFLNGITIDYVDTLKESGFKYINPNASNSCGCGVSFS